MKSQITKMDIFYLPKSLNQLNVTTRQVGRYMCDMYPGDLSKVDILMIFKLAL